MIDLKSVPCLQDHFEQIALTEQKAVEAVAQEVQYARAPAGPGYQPAGRPATTQRNSR